MAPTRNSSVPEGRTPALAPRQRSARLGESPLLTGGPARQRIRRGTRVCGAEAGEWALGCQRLQQIGAEKRLRVVELGGPRGCESEVGREW